MTSLFTLLSVAWSHGRNNFLMPPKVAKKSKGSGAANNDQEEPDADMIAIPAPFMCHLCGVFFPKGKTHTVCPKGKLYTECLVAITQKKYKEENWPRLFAARQQHVDAEKAKAVAATEAAGILKAKTSGTGASAAPKALAAGAKTKGASASGGNSRKRGPPEKTDSASEDDESNDEDVSDDADVAPAAKEKPASARLESNEAPNVVAPIPSFELVQKFVGNLAQALKDVAREADDKAARNAAIGPVRDAHVAVSLILDACVPDATSKAVCVLIAAALDTAKLSLDIEGNVDGFVGKNDGRRARGLHDAGVALATKFTVLAESATTRAITGRGGDGTTLSDGLLAGQSASMVTCLPETVNMSKFEIGDITRFVVKSSPQIMYRYVRVPWSFDGVLLSARTGAKITLTPASVASKCLALRMHIDEKIVRDPGFQTAMINAVEFRVVEVTQAHKLEFLNGMVPRLAFCSGVQLTGTSSTTPLLAPSVKPALDAMREFTMLLYPNNDPVALGIVKAAKIGISQIDADHLSAEAALAVQRAWAAAVSSYSDAVANLVATGTLDDVDDLPDFASMFKLQTTIEAARRAVRADTSEITVQAGGSAQTAAAKRSKGASFSWGRGGANSHSNATGGKNWGPKEAVAAPPSTKGTGPTQAVAQQRTSGANAVAVSVIPDRCFNFTSGAGCRFGDSCKFTHEEGASGRASAAGRQSGGTHWKAHH